MLATLRIFLVAFILMAAPAFAQSDEIDILGRRAYELLPQAKISSGETIGEERAKTLPYPMIPRPLMEFVVKRSHVAAFAAHCGLDWQKGFYQPMMGFLREREKSFTDYQWAYVGILHGVAMGSAESTVKDRPCDDAMRQNLMNEAK